jgi:hypothetical protein
MNTRGNKKVLPLHAMKAYTGSTGIAPLILNLGTRRMWVVGFMIQLLYVLGQELPVRTQQEPRWGQEPDHTFWKTEKPLPLPVIEPHTPGHSTVTIPTKLP